MGDNTIKITGNNATIEGIDLPADDVKAMGLRFTYHTQAPATDNFEVDFAMDEVTSLGPVSISAKDIYWYHLNARRSPWFRKQ